MATVGTGVSLATTTNAATYTTGSFTPAEGDLLVVICGIPATVSTPTATASANGITFTRVIDEAWSGSAHTHAWFVADQLVPASPSSMTVTVDVTGDNGNGGNVVVLRVTGMSKVGTAAVKQATANSNAVGTGGTYTLTFGAATDTNNPIILALTNNTNPATMTPPSGFTEIYDIGFSSPTNGLEVNKVDSGQTSDNYTWGSTSATVGTANGLELDASSSGVTGTLATTLAGATLAASGTETMTGTLAVTLDGASLAATGAETFTGTLASTLDGATLAASGQETFTGSLAATLDGASLASSGNVSSPAVTGTLATTLDGATLEASGTETLTGSLAATLDGVTLAGSGTVAPPVTGTLAATLDGATLSASGTAGAAPVTGTLATTLAGATLAAAAVETIAGTLATTLDGAALAATATETLSGTLAATLDDTALTATGTQTVSGTLSTALDGATLEASGTVTNLTIDDLGKVVGAAPAARFSGGAPTSHYTAGTLTARYDGDAPANRWE